MGLICTPKQSVMMALGSTCRMSSPKSVLDSYNRLLLAIGDIQFLTIIQSISPYTYVEQTKVDLPPNKSC